MEFRNLSRFQSLTLMCQLNGKLCEGIFITRVITPLFTIVSWRDVRRAIFIFIWISLVQTRSVAQSCPTRCDPMYCSTPGFPVHHQLPEFNQTHAHWVSDAIPPFHPLLSPSPPTLIFSNESLPIRWPEYWGFSISPSNEYSGLIVLSAKEVLTHWLLTTTFQIFCHSLVSGNVPEATQLVTWPTRILKRAALRIMWLTTVLLCFRNVVLALWKEKNWDLPSLNCKTHRCDIYDLFDSKQGLR